MGVEVNWTAAVALALPKVLLLLQKLVVHEICSVLREMAFMVLALGNSARHCSRDCVVELVPVGCFPPRRVWGELLDLLVKVRQERIGLSFFRLGILLLARVLKSQLALVSSHFKLRVAELT